ncbi:sigma factor-like helix-turn-helix DNA-binding protein, partial [Streptomyces sp. WAC00469]|uniref:sigma factor-like helix-turn-helix DNA-binding protein n=1 Tax=Streptomyces sp. WAC00469 TaxID=2487415 RepID=UPI00163BA273
MRDRRAPHGTHRDRGFEAFVAGAAGRLLHTATLLTAEDPQHNPRACHLLTLALADTYAGWDRLRGDDPYDRTRQYLAGRFAREAWHRYGRLSRTRRRPPGVLGALAPHERLVLVLRLHEGVAEEQTAALLGLPAERVRVLCDRAVSRLTHPARRPATAVDGPGAGRRAGWVSRETARSHSTR